MADRTIECIRCGETYQSAVPFPESKQGVCCDSGVVKRDGALYLWCGYGSGFDGNIYEILDVGAETWPKGPVCDRCITDGVNRGALRFYHDDCFIDLPWY